MGAGHSYQGEMDTAQRVGIASSQATSANPQPSAIPHTMQAQKRKRDESEELEATSTLRKTSAAAPSTAASPDEAVAAEPNVVRFTDLAADCLREICDRLQIRELCAIAATCRKLQAIAHQSFVGTVSSRLSLGAVRFGHETDIRVTDRNTCLKVLKEFGEHMTSVNMHVQLLKHAEIREQLMRLQLHALHLGLNGILTPEEAGSVAPLLANLTELGLHNQAPGERINIPLAMCKQLTSLTLNNIHERVARECLSMTFPRLKSIHIEHIEARDVADFMRRHPQLTTVTFMQDTAVDYAILCPLHQLDTLTIGVFNQSMMALTEVQRLRSLKITRCADLQFLDDFVVQAAAVQDTLQELDLHFWTDSSLWHCLARLKGLRVLRLSGSVSDQPVPMEAIQRLICQLPCIETIVVETRMNDSRAALRNRSIDQLCLNRNISLVIHGSHASKIVANADGGVLHVGTVSSYVKWERVCVRFGRYDRTTIGCGNRGCGVACLPL